MSPLIESCILGSISTVGHCCCNHQPGYEPSKQGYLLNDLVPVQRADIPAHRAATSPESSEQVYLLTELVAAQRAGIPAHQAGSSAASRYTCSPSWYQPSEQVYLLAELVAAQRAGIPARQAGSSPASRYTCSPSWYQPSEQVYLLTELVPAQRAGIPAHRAGTSPASRYTCSPSWYQPSEQVYLLTELVPAHRAVRAVLEQPCSTGGRTGTVQPKHLLAGRTGLSDQFLGPVAQDQPGPVGQICPTSWLLLWSDSVRPTTGQTRLFEHRLSSRV
ncbi:hypothetical protein PCASD_00212 [Puccinia coronata f. sp. avenae]|uniref:Uncharacterized protein n=1 Tax=Puccinia coronata f. sp. avenae TaxID=200324 RepID=A0A2N5VQS5_9BASI|nr:hypothetical protein PCASD_00212 [Puccinia coronata f. sp. avenae]